MTNEEILKKAVDKAIKSGYDKYATSNIEGMAMLKTALEKNMFLNQTYPSVIFSHSFAKAFWGKETVCSWCGSKACWEGEMFCDQYKAAGTSEQWEYNLQQLVLESEPLRYLKKFL